MWARIGSRAAHLAAEHLPVGARVLVVETAPARNLCGAFEKRGLDVTGVTTVPERALVPPTGKTGVFPWDLLVLGMGLSEKDGTDRHALPETARGLAPLALFVDWQRAERNLEVPAEGLRRLFFRLTMPSARRCSLAAYEASGGLEGVLYAWRRQGKVVARQSCLGGCVGLALVAWERGAPAVEQGAAISGRVEAVGLTAALLRHPSPRRCPAPSKDRVPDPSRD